MYIKADTSEDLNMRRSLAEDHGTPARTLRRLAEDPDHTVRLYTTFNPNTPADALASIAHNHTDYYELRGVVEHLNTPPEVLAELAEDPPCSWDDSLRTGIAANPNTPVDTLYDIYYNAEREFEATILLALSSNPSTPEDLRKAVVSRIKELKRAYSEEARGRGYINDSDPQFGPHRMRVFFNWGEMQPDVKYGDVEEALCNVFTNNGYDVSSFEIIDCDDYYGDEDDFSDVAILYIDGRIVSHREIRRFEQLMHDAFAKFGCYTIECDGFDD